MNVLCYLDPFVTADEIAISRRSHLCTWIPAFALQRECKREHRVMVIASETELNRNDLGTYLRERKVPFIAVPQKLTDRLLPEFNISFSDLIKETATIDSFVSRYGEILREMLGEWTPDLIVGCEQLPRYLQKIFPKSVCIEQPSSGLYKALKNADSFPYPIYTNKEFKFRLNDALDKWTLDERSKLKLDLYRDEFHKSYIRPINFSRVDIDPTGKFRKIFFWPGLLFYGSLVKNVCSYKNEDKILEHLLKILPEDCAIALTRHPIAVRVNDAAIDITPNMSARLIDLSALSDGDGMLSIYALAACDAMINMQSKIVDIAAVLKKPVFDIDSEKLHSSRLLALSETEMTEWALSNEDTNAVLLWKKKSDNYLYYLLTKKVPAAFFHAENNAFRYYEVLVNNIKNGVDPISVLPTLSTIDEAIQDIQTSLVSDRFDVLLFKRPQNTYEKIRGKILDPAVKVIGFDVFDTALCRYVTDPKDIFELMDAEVSAYIRGSRANDLALTKFGSIRSVAEQTINAVIKDAGGDRQVTFDEIYEMIGEMLQCDVSIIEKIKKLEIVSELKYIRPRYSIRALYQLALEHGKRIVFISDMYLSSSIINKFLQSNGYTKFERVYSSADSGKKKGNGKLYIQVLSDLCIAPSEMIFIGDNKISDVERPSKIGINAYHYPSAFNQFMSIPGIRKNFSFFLKNNRFQFYIGMASNKIFDNPFINYRRESILNRSLYIMGYLISGPAMMGLSLWLAEKMKQNGHDKLLLCARDGYFVQKIYDKINQSLYSGRLAKSVYFYASRAAVQNLAVNTPFFVCTLDTSYRACSRDITVRDYFSRIFDLKEDRKSIEEIIRNSGVALDYSYIEQRHKIFSIMLDNKKKFSNFIVSNDLAEEYFLHHTNDSNNPAFFDLGTRGSIPRMLAESTNRNIKTYLFVVDDYRVSDFFVEGFHRIRPSRYDDNEKDAKEAVFEPVFCASHEETTKAYVRGEGGIAEPVVKRASYAIEARNRSVVQQGMMDFCEDCFSVYGASIAHMFRNSQDACMRGFDFVAHNMDDASFLSSQYSIDHILLNKEGNLRLSMPKPSVKSNSVSYESFNLDRKELFLSWIFGSSKKYARFKGKIPYNYWNESKNPFYRTFRFFCRKPI